MIRINLLGGPRAKVGKTEWDVHLELIGGAALIILTVVACIYYSGVLDGQIGARQLEKEQKNKQLAVLQEKLKQVQDFEQRKKLLEDKNRIIETLEKSRAGPVKVLDHVSQSLEPLKIWLIRLSIKGNDVELEGRALTNDDIVEFVNNLNRTEHFTNIRLLETRAGSEAKLNVYQFKVNLSLKT
jgi:type IV pilus assembly protein PilN